MTVELRSEETQMAEEAAIPQDEQPTDKKTTVAEELREAEAEAETEATEKNGNGCPADEGSPANMKSSSFKEESNFPSDLKPSERKALTELKSKLEEAVLGNTLFTKSETEEAVDEEEEEEESREISLWGVPLLPSKGSECTDVVLLKFLRARDFKVADAFEMLKKTLQWRKDNRIEGIVGDDVAPELEPAAYMDGTDREGHPVCYNIYGVFGEEEMYQKTFGSEEKKERFLKWRVQVMEKGIQKLDFKPGGVSSLLQVSI